MLIIDLKGIEKAKNALSDGDRAVLVALADDALLTEVNPVSNKKHLRFGATKNDFVSAAPYWWPNPDTEDGLPYVKKDGQINPVTTDDDYYDRNRLNVMAKTVSTLAVAWLYTQDEKYKIRAAEHINRWFVDPQTRMNPSLDFAQQIAGICIGRDFGIIDTTALVDVFDSAMAVGCDSPALRQWAKDYLHWLLTSPNGIAEAKKDNNHGLWYDTQVMAFAAFVGNTSLVKATAKSMKERIAQHIDDNGSLPMELARTRSYLYSMFALRGIYYAHLIAKQYGWGFLTDGHKKCFEFLRPYANLEKPWPYLEIVGVDPSVIGNCMSFGYRIYGDRSFYEAAQKYYGRIAESDNAAQLLRFPLYYEG